MAFYASLLVLLLLVGLAVWIVITGLGIARDTTKIVVGVLRKKE